MRLAKTRAGMTIVAASAPLPHSPAAANAGGTASSPPLVLPAKHFTAALVFFACGALGLVVIAPDLAAGAFYQPRVVAVVHLFTLGWIILSIFGALCQFLPVAVSRPIRWVKLADLSFVLQVAGVAIFVTGILSGRAPVLYLGAGLVSTAFLVFAANLAATLGGVEAGERSLTWWALAGACIFLVVTPAFGLVLAVNLHHGALGADRFALLARHVHVAIGGVVLLVMVGVAHRLLPMFLLSHGASERAGRTAVALLFAGASLLAVPLGGMVTAGLGGAFLAAGVVAFLMQARSFYRHSKRKKVDPGMRLAAAGLVGLAGAVLVAPFAMYLGLTNLRLLAAYHLILLGALSLFVAGHYYKIVPFLIWYHRFGPLVGLRKVPKVNELYSERLAVLVATLLVTAWLGLVAGTCIGSVELTRISALVFASGALGEAVAIAAIAQRRPA